MGTWFSKVIGALGGDAADRARAVQMLHAAQRGRIRVNLELVSAGNTVVLATTVEQVRDDDLIISQPTIGGLTHPLAFGETITIGFAMDGTYHTGISKCLGRVRIPSGGAGAAGAGANGESEAMLYAYRLAIPDGITSQERREEPRVMLRFTGAVEAQLYAHAMIDGPIFGHIENISMSGASIVTQVPPRRIERGQTIYMKTKLPEPGGLIDDLVSIARVDVNPRTGQCTIGVSFQQRLEAIELLMRGARPVAA